MNLALPFFGLIFLGFVCGKIKRLPDHGLAWMGFFVVYVALPALFYRILAQTPFAELAQVWFIVGTTLSTFSVFVVAFAISYAMRRRNLAEATIAAVAGSYGNIGFMGPGLAIATLGAQATAPVALIFCFDQLLLFTLVPLLMSFAGDKRRGPIAALTEVGIRIGTNPFIVASALGVISAAVHFQPPIALERLLAFLQNGAAPCALFALGVTVALRPLDQVPWEVPILSVIKLIVHPTVVLVILSLLGPFAEAWMATAILMAALPQALNVFVMARQYDAWVSEASSAVLLGTLLSVVTLTAVMWMVKTHALPLHVFH